MKMDPRSISVISVLFALHPVHGGNVGPRIFARKIECKQGPLLHNHTCSISKGSAWTIDMNLKEGLVLHNIIFKTSWLHKTAKDKNYKPFLGFHNVVIDFCKYVDHGSLKIIDLIMGLLKDYSNITHKCPYSGHVYIKDFIPKINRWPGAVLYGEYIVSSNVFSNRTGQPELLIDLKMYADAIPGSPAI